MISRTAIQQFVDQVVEQFQPVKVILFGSYANGSPTEDSDVDLMLIMPHRGSSARIATQVRLACPRDFPMDLIVRSPAEVRRRIKMGDSFLQEVTSTGIVLPCSLKSGADAPVGCEGGKRCDECAAFEGTIMPGNLFSDKA